MAALTAARLSHSLKVPLEPILAGRYLFRVGRPSEGVCIKFPLKPTLPRGEHSNQLINHLADQGGVGKAKWHKRISGYREGKFTGSKFDDTDADLAWPCIGMCLFCVSRYSDPPVQIYLLAAKGVKQLSLYLRW